MLNPKKSRKKFLPTYTAFSCGQSHIIHFEIEVTVMALKKKYCQYHILKLMNFMALPAFTSQLDTVLLENFAWYLILL